MKLFDRIFGRKSSQKDLSKDIVENDSIDHEEDNSDVVGYKYMDSIDYRMLSMYRKNSEESGSYPHFVDFFKRSIRCVENILGLDDKEVSNNLNKKLSLIESIKMFEDSVYKLKIDDSIVYGEGLDQPIISDISGNYENIPARVFGDYFKYVNTVKITRKYIDGLVGLSTGFYCFMLRILDVPTKDIDNLIFCNKSQFNKIKELSPTEDWSKLDEVLKEKYPMTRLRSLGNEESMDYSYFKGWR